MMSLRVKAVQRGYYGNVLRREGDVFTLARESDVSARWMVRVSNDAPEQRTTAQQALDVAHDRFSPLGRTRRVAEPAPDDEPGVEHDFNPFESKP